MRNLKLIDPKDRSKHKCYFCGSEHSVKYTTEVVNPIESSDPVEVYVCNVCALKYPNKGTPTMKVYRSVHGTVNVVIQNCSAEVATLLSRFDVWNAGGQLKYDEAHPDQRPEIWYECPMEFISILQSDGRMLRAAFERMGVKEITVY